MALTEHQLPIYDDIPVVEGDHLTPQQRAVNFVTRQERFSLVPPSPNYVKVTNRKGGLSIQFIRVPDADGYEVSVASDAGMTNLQYRQVWEGNRNTSGFVPLGQVAGTFYARVRSKKGSRHSRDIQGGPCGISQITGTANEITAGTEGVPPQVGGPEGSGVPFSTSTVFRPDEPLEPFNQ